MCPRAAGRRGGEWSYGDTVKILLADTLGLSLTLLEGVLVLELGSHLGWLLMRLLAKSCGVVVVMVVVVILVD